ncbi:MAG: hypothetical protein ACEPOV_08880 [Hyphomicrobiales bacterium]
MNKLLSISLLFITLLSLSSCTSNDKPLEYKYITMENDTWNRFFSPTFEFEINNADIKYDFYLVAKVNRELPVNTIPFVLATSFDNGDERAVKLNFQIMDKDHQFYGEFKDGYYICKVPLRKNYFAHKKGTIKLEVTNTTSKFNLEGVHSVGIEMYKSKKK